MSSGLKMGLNLVKASVRTCRVSGREGEDLLSPWHPGQAWEVRPLLLSPAPPGLEGPRLSCVSPRPPGPRAQSRSLHPTPPDAREVLKQQHHMCELMNLVLRFRRTMPRGSHHWGGLHGEGPYSVFRIFICGLQKVCLQEAIIYILNINDLI